MMQGHCLNTQVVTTGTQDHLYPVIQCVCSLKGNRLCDAGALPEYSSGHHWHTRPSVSVKTLCLFPEGE